MIFRKNADSEHRHSVLSRTPGLSRPRLFAIAPMLLGLRQAEPDREGLRVLLHRRLRLAATIGSLLAAARLLRQLLDASLRGKESASHQAAVLLASLCVVAIGVLLWRRRYLPLTLLRGVELLLLAFASTAMYFTGLGVLSSVHVVSSPPPTELQTPSNHLWLVYSNGSGFVERLYVALASRVIVSFGLLAVAYGVLIPNTWRRCMFVLLFIVFLAELCVLHAVLRTPALFTQLLPFAWNVFYGVGAFAAFSLYGCSKLSALREAAEQAREVGQYLLEERLGQGGMGEVYRARHRMLRRPCAVKLIRADQAGSPDTLARFEREVQAMAQLTHPNTVEIYDYGRGADGTLYYAMEYLPGLTLEQLIRRYGPLEPGRAVYLLLQACRALREAHRAGLIHRDVKPGNIYVTERGGEFDIVKLLDFGLVRVQGISEPSSAPSAALSSEGAENPALTQAGHILGTPAYLSPEQVAGSTVDARSDIYSLGTVAYFILTGHPPFQCATVAELLQAHLQEPPLDPAKINLAVPRDLADVVLCCLAKRPEERYASASALESVLSHCGCCGTWDAARAEQWWRSRPVDSSQATADSEDLSSSRTADFSRH